MWLNKKGLKCPSLNIYVAFTALRGVLNNSRGYRDFWSDHMLLEEKVKLKRGRLLA